MATETIYRHTCDWCKKQQDESAQSGFLPCGGKDNWSAFNIEMAGTASSQYAASGRLEFCSYDCAINWMQKQIETQNEQGR